jgi:DNA polymerase
VTVNKNQHLNNLCDAWANCQGCPLAQERRNVVFGHGQAERVPIFDAGGSMITVGGLVMIVGEAPGDNEDKHGLPFIGQAGQLLDQYLGVASARDDVIEAYEMVTSSQKMSDAQRDPWKSRLKSLLLQEFYFTNIVMCRPMENRDPTPKEMTACRTRLLEQIYTVDPVFIIAAGKIAAEALVGRKMPITQVRGEIFEVDFPGRGTTFRYPVMPVLHPAYLLRKNDFKQKGGDTEKTKDDFIKIMQLVDEYAFHHYGIPKPPRRPKLEKARR